MTDLHNSQQKTLRRAEYISRINRVIDYVQSNLAEELSLDTLAKQANFSRFHFHRIFKAMIGETVNQYIQRLRIEKAATQLRVNPKKSVTEIALDCGFKSSATFARAFKECFQMNASEWRIRGFELDSKMRKADSNNGKTLGKNGQPLGKDGKDFAASYFYIDPVTHNQKWRINVNNNQQIQVEVKEIEEMNVAYIRHIGPYQGKQEVFAGLFNKLMGWAGPRGLLGNPGMQVLCVYHDDPKITQKDKLRVDACITVPKDTSVDGEVGNNTVPGGKYAFARFEVSPDRPEDFGKAWDRVMGDWLPESGYQPDDRPCFELYHGDPKQHPEGKIVFDICVPVKPL